MVVYVVRNMREMFLICSIMKWNLILIEAYAAGFFQYLSLVQLCIYYTYDILQLFISQYSKKVHYHGLFVILSYTN